MARFGVFDVFTESRFGGNQLAVVYDAETLAEGDLQPLAREFNFSETTFVFPSSRADTDADVRIFTPTNEIPFAGHPTIGTAIALAERLGQNELVLNLGVGPIACKVTPGTPTQASFQTAVPLQRLGLVDAPTIAACLGLEVADIRQSTHQPEIASVGLPFALVELASAGALAKATGDLSAFRKAEARYANDIDMFAIFLYVRDQALIDARMFAPLNNIPEDPATGSAAAALTSYLSEIEGKPLDLTINQGVQMGRASLIRASSQIDAAGGISITIAGSAVKTLSGEIL